MTRVAVAVENCPMGDSRVIDLKALSPLGPSIPVLFDGDWDYIGEAINFERDENNVIWFEILLFEPWEERVRFDGDYYAHISVGQCLWDGADEHVILRSGVIYNIQISERRTPWDVINHRAV